PRLRHLTPTPGHFDRGRPRCRRSEAIHRFRSVAGAGALALAEAPADSDAPE
ncbi:unnamed protein product, partial [Effrenium voratum]